MKRISDELFVTGENRTYSLDDVIASVSRMVSSIFLGGWKMPNVIPFSGQNQILRLKGIF